MLEIISSEQILPKEISLVTDRPKLKKVVASKKPFHQEYTQLIRGLFTEVAKKNGKLAAEIGSKMRVRYKRGEWKLNYLEFREGGEAAARITGNTLVEYYYGMPFQEHKFQFTENIILYIKNATSWKRNPKGAGKGYVDFELWLRLKPDEVQALCGGSTKPEKFMLATALTTLADSKFGSMTPYTDPKTLKTRKKSQKTNIVVRLPSGRLLFLPPIDTRDKITKELRESFDEENLTFDTSKQTFKHDIIYWNLEVGELKYISSSGQQMSYAISGSSELSRSATLTILKSKWEDIVIKLGRDPWQSTRSALQGYSDREHEFREALRPVGTYYAETPEVFIRELIILYEEDKARRYLEGCAKWLRSKEASDLINHPLRRYSILAIITLMSQFVGKVDALEDEIKERIRSMQEATIKDMPTLPGNLREDLEFYPHQADSLAKADRAEESIGFDVSTGGGKTLLIICYILNEMQKGNIRKPMIVMPKNLISQWFDQIHYFTNSTFNCIVMETATKRRWGDKIFDLAKTAPLNTIFLSTYSYLKLGCSEELIGGRKTYYFPLLDQIKELNFDLIILDECVVGNTLVNTTKGLVPIESLFDKDHEVNTWRKANIPVLTKEGIEIANGLYKGKAKTIKVVTEFGYEIEGTENHPVQVLNENLEFEWKLLRDITKEDNLCIQRKKAYWPKELVRLNFKRPKYHFNAKISKTPKYLTGDLARFLGYLVAEGGLGKTGTGLSQDPGEILNDIIRIGKKYFGNRCKVYPNYSKKEGSKRVRVCGKHLRDFFAYCGMTKGSYWKEIPWCIFQSPKEVVAEFIRGLWEGDGNVSTSGLIMSSSSKKLVKQLQILLLNFGIFSKIRYVWDDRWSEVKLQYYLTVTHECYSLFYKHIGFVSHKNNSKFEVKCDGTFGRKVCKDLIPFLDLTRERIREKGFGNGRYVCAGNAKAVPLSPLSGYRGYSYEKSYEKVIAELKKGHIKIIDKNIHEKLKTIVDYRFFFDRPKSIKKSSVEKFVYDLKVPGSHSFIANGIIVHNSHNIKNSGSKAHQALLQLAQRAPRKGIATGTITPNKQSDIVGQISFIDSSIFGTKEDFEKEFLVDPKAGIFAEGSEAIIQDRLRSVGVITKTRKDWFFTLPKINDNFHIVEMTKRQKELYDALVTETLSAFDTDPGLSAAWLQFQMDPESENIPPQFLARLHMIESFSSDPAASVFGIEGLISGDDLISPKLPVVKKILEKHFSETPEDKVLIFSQYQAKVIDHFYENLGEFKDLAKLYRGGMKKNLDAFKTDPNTKILVACDRCFSGDTPVLVDYDTALPIKEVCENPEITHVLAYDLEREEIVKQRINHKFINEVAEDDIFMNLSIAGKEKGKRYTVKVTANHKIWSSSRNTYVSVNRLEDGEKVITCRALLCEETEVLSVTESTDKFEKRYTLEVDDQHNYFVMAQNMNNILWGVPLLVANSIKEGQNLQMASRMIRLDVHWSPGDLDQVIARIYRLLKSMGIEREFVNIDWVLANNTIDVLKFRRTIRKLVLNSSMMGIVPKDAIPQRPIITVNPDTLLYSVDWNQASKDEVQDYNRYRELEKEQWEEIRKTQSIDFIPVKRGKEIPGEIINTPIPEGASIPGGDDKVTAEDALDEWGNKDPKSLLGHKCMTEFGPGTIINANRNSEGVLKVKVEFEDEELEITSFPGSIVEVFEEIDPQYGKKKLDIEESGVDVKIGGAIYWLTPEGLLHGTRKKKGAYIKGKVKYVFDGFQWLTPTGRNASKVTPKIDAGLRKALSKLGYKFPKGVGVIPEEEKPENEYRFKKTEDGLKKTMVLKSDGTISIINDKDKTLKPHIKFDGDDFIYTRGIKKGKVAFKGKLKTRLIAELEAIKPKKTKKVKTPKSKLPKATDTRKLQFGDEAKFITVNGIKGFKFKTPRGFFRLMDAKGRINIYKPKTDVLKPKYDFDETTQSWKTLKGRTVNFTPEETKKLLDALGKLRGGKAIKVPKTKTLKVPKKEDTDKAVKQLQPLSVSLKAINFGGVAAITVLYEDEERADEINLALKGKKFQAFPFKRISPLTVPKLNRLKTALEKGTIQPVNKDALTFILDNWRKAELHMADYDKTAVKTLKVALKRKWLTNDFFILPVIIDGKLEIWLPAVREKVFKKLLPVLKRLKFEDDKVFMRHFLVPSGLPQGGTFTLSQLKAKKIKVTNIKEFKTSIKDIKKRLS